MMANCRAYVNKRNPVDELKYKLVASELKAVEVADHGRGNAFRLKKLLSEFLNVRGSYFFQHGDQFLRGVVPVEIDVIAGEARHALPGAFQRQKRGAFQVVFCAAQLFFGKWLVFHAAKFLENGAYELRNCFQRRARIYRKHSCIAIRIHLAENRISQTLALANILKEP